MDIERGDAVNTPAWSPERKPSAATVTRHVRSYGWNWFLMPMTTLGLSTLLYGQTKLRDFHGLYTIGLVFYFIGLLQFVFLIITQTTRYVLVKGSLQASFANPDEAMFFAAFWISCYGTITGAVDYSDPAPGSNLSLCLLVLFWMYLVGALCASIGLHMLIFHEKHLENKNMTPAWLLPVLPIILTGVMAGSFSGRLHTQQLFSVEVAGLICSSMGFLLSISIGGIYLDRLFVAGIPEPDRRPGMLVAVGPPSYAPLAFLRIGSGLPIKYWFFTRVPGSEAVIETMSLVLSVGVWGLAVFYFLIGICSIVVVARRITFHLTWYSFIFPLVGFLSTLGLIGKELSSAGIMWTATVLTVVLCGVWFFVTGSHIWAIWTRKV